MDELSAVPAAARGFDRPQCDWRPADAVGRGPVVLVVPGTGSFRTELVNAARGLVPGAALLTVGPGSADAESAANLGVEPLDATETWLEAAASAVAKAVDGELARRGVDRRALITVAHGLGSGVVLSLVAGGRLFGLGLVLLQPPAAPTVASWPELNGLPVFLAARRAEPAADDRLVSLGCTLQQAGAQVTLRWRDQGGEITDAELRAARTWLRLVGVASVATDSRGVYG